MSRVLLAKARRLTRLEPSLVPPLGVLCLGAALREAGHEVRVFDPFDDDDDRRFVAELATSRPDVVGLSALTYEEPALARMAAAARETLPAARVVVGGPHASAYPERCLALGGVDYAIRGEGDESLVELVRALEAGASAPWRTPGVISRGPDGELREVRRDPPADLDALPPAAWDLVDLDRYGRFGGIGPLGAHRYALIGTSRGCPYRCFYCHQVHGKRFRARSPEGVLAEMRALHERTGVRDFEIVDDVFNLDRERTLALLEGVARLPFRAGLSFPNGLRADLLDEAQIRALRRAGTRFLSVAVESAVPRLQRLIGKRLDVGRVDASIRLAARHGLFVNGFFMLGFPTETLAEARETVRFAVRSRLHQALFFFVTPYAGTALFEGYRDLLRQRGVPEDVENLNYHRGRVNLSAMTDAELFGLQREAFRRFYFDPVRVLRIARRHPRRRLFLRQGLSVLTRRVLHLEAS